MITIDYGIALVIMNLLPTCRIYELIRRGLQNLSVAAKRDVSPHHLGRPECETIARVITVISVIILS